MRLDGLSEWIDEKDLPYRRKCLKRLAALLGPVLEPAEILALASILGQYGILFSDGFLINDESVWDHGLPGSRLTVAMAMCFAAQPDPGYEYWKKEYHLCNKTSDEHIAAKRALLGRLFEGDAFIRRGKTLIWVAAVGPDVVWYGPWFPKIHEKFLKYLKALHRKRAKYRRCKAEKLLTERDQPLPVGRPRIRKAKKR